MNPIVFAMRHPITMLVGIVAVVLGSVLVLANVLPDHVTVAGGGAYPAIVADVADIGTITMLTLRLPGGPELRVRTTDPGELQPGDACRVDLDPAAITIWPSGASAHSLSSNPA